MVTDSYGLMPDNSVYNEDVLRDLYEHNTPAQISKILKIDPRKTHRALRNAGFISTTEPLESIRMRIKDTEKGRKLAKALRLEVNKVYPDVHK